MGDCSGEDGIVTQPVDAEEHARLEEQAERIRQRFLSNPDFLEIIRRSQEDERSGRVISHEEAVRRLQSEE
jgi:hypothetical protein